MADLFSIPAADEAQGRRRQMLRTAFGATIAAALADPAVIEVMVNPDGKLWISAPRLGARTAVSTSPAPRLSASSGWWPHTCAGR